MGRKKNFADHSSQKKNPLLVTYTPPIPHPMINGVDTANKPLPGKKRFTIADEMIRIKSAVLAMVSEEDLRQALDGLKTMFDNPDPKIRLQAISAFLTFTSGRPPSQQTIDKTVQVTEQSLHVYTQLSEEESLEKLKQLKLK